VALSRRFHWVRVDRDRTPEIPKRFGVHAYPTLLTLGPKDTKIHRFQGFCEPVAFRARLADALRRYDLYRAGREWDDPLPRPADLCAEGTVETCAAPCEEIPDGIAFLAGRTWIAQQGRLTWLGGDRVFEVARSIIDLCTDGRLLYGIDYGWTAGRPIYAIDPSDGHVAREIVTEENRKRRAMGAKGVAWRAGKLYALEGMSGVLCEVEPETGKVTRRIRTEGRWLAGLAFDGRAFVAGSRDALWWFDPKSGRTLRKLAVNYPLRTVGFHDGSYFLMEQPVFGYDKQHARVRLWPKSMLVYKLTLRTKQPTPR
jgi:hypothetical protein